MEAVASRYPWNGFPPAVLAAEEERLTRHPHYEAAKRDVDAAKRVVSDLCGSPFTASLRHLIGRRKPVLVPVHAMESDGYNRLPAVFATVLADRLGLEVETGIVQANVVRHTGAGEWERMTRPAVFDGRVQAGKDYLVVDDFVGQGGTLANLRGHLLQGGARVLGAAALTGREDGATLAVTPGTLAALKAKHAKTTENEWHEAFGYRFDCLTEGEARFLRDEDAERLRARLAARGSEEDG